MSDMQVGKPHLRDIHAPAPLRDMPGWLCWKYETHAGDKKPRKVPMYANGERRYGQQGAPKDLAKLTTFAVACDAAIRRNMDGVGFAHTEAGGIVTLDFDNCVHDGVVDPQVLDLVGNTYAEFSPSGKGVHAIYSASHDVLGNPKSHANAEQFGVEAFSSVGFTTFSGWMLDHVDLLGYEDRVAPLPQRVIEFCQTRFGPSAPAKVDPDDFMIGREPKLGLTVDQMELAVADLDPDMSREDWIKVGMALHHECDGDDTGFEIFNEWSACGGKYPSEEALRQQWDSFDRRKGSARRQVTMATVLRMAKLANDAGGMPSKNEWPTPSPLPEALLPVPAMEREMLPKELAPWLTDIAERMSVPLDFVATPAMVMLGALIGGKVEVRPQEKTDWSEPANLWGAIVASPGAMKSPVVNQVFAPIKKLEAEAQSRNKEVLEKHRVDSIVSKTSLDAAITNAKKNADTSTPDALAELLMGLVVEPPKPKLKRYITTDATVEKLGEICADNPDGILYHRDELPTLFTDLQREEKATARGFMLTGWAGTGSYTFDRVARGTTHIEAVNISLFGTAQPQRVANLVSVSAAKHDDGMIQRLQLLVWPDFVDEWVPADRFPDAAARVSTPV